jgi:hypothetical protein
VSNLKAYNVLDVAREGSRPSPWSEMDGKLWVMSDRLTLVDESANFEFSPLQINDNLRYITHYPGYVEFELLKYMALPRERKEIEAFFSDELPSLVAGKDKIEHDVGYHVDQLCELGLIRKTTESFHEIRGLEAR